MKNMTLENIAYSCGGTYIGDEKYRSKEVAGVVIDSRKVEKDYLFISIKGERVDGHNFIPAVFEQGAAAVLSEHKLENPQGPYILVESTEKALKDIAAFYRSSLDIKVVGITGSVGKTSTKEMIASILETKYRVLKTAGNFNNEIGLPLTIFRLKESDEVAVLEMGISDFGEMDRLAQIAKPDIGVITNIGLCHLENLGTRDGIRKAKTEMFAHIKEGGSAVLNGDDDQLAKIMTVQGKPPVFYGKNPLNLEETPNMVYASDIENLGLEGMKGIFHFGEESLKVQIPIPGEHNVMNALAGACVGRLLGLSLEEIQRGIANAKTISGRTNLIHANDTLIIDDCYNANPVSMKASIDVLAQQKGRTIAVLGDMGELGSEEKKLHYEVGAYAAEKKIDALFCTGELSKELVKGVTENGTWSEVFYFDDKEALITALKEYRKSGDTILVKASHFMEFPEIVKELEQ